MKSARDANDVIPWDEPFLLLPRLCRYAVTHMLSRQSLPDFKEALAVFPGLRPAEEVARACFATLHHSEGGLRGCMGTLFPQYSSLTEEIIHNAAMAAFQDPRFPPLRQEELSRVSFSCDVLEEPRKTVFSALDPQRFGVIVTLGSRRGVLLPRLEGITSSKEQVRIAMSKAGIPWANFEDVHLMSFEARRYEEDSP